MAYIRSTGRPTQGELLRFQHHIEAVIEQYGPICISKDVGMFEVSQPFANKPTRGRRDGQEPSTEVYNDGRK